ncbi:FAD:protein FMN transferase, partial [Amycolatopsis sp. H20-H5]|uniref:FAD:protein FMN transferase n=1 Tax=Amycolatopsis sp. H20-H5 TaxID=3046309 RepID=UPI002DB90B8D
TTAVLLVTDPAGLGRAEDLLRAGLAELDLACSRFRADSEISRLHESAGRATRVGPLLFEAIRVALRAARLTEGLVDPTVGAAVRELGYDRDFPEVAGESAAAVGPAGPVPGWHRVLLDPARGEVVLPRGVLLDLGATAKALAADRAAVTIARRTGAGVLVGLGGDLRADGPPPPGGWRIAVGDNHARAAEHGVPVTLRSGGLATSSITQRTWRRAGRTVHHIVDPRTGDVPVALWRTVSAAALSCVDANTATTGAIVLGSAAPSWLATGRLPARLVGVDGQVHVVGGWPADETRGVAA